MIGLAIAAFFENSSGNLFGTRYAILGYVGLLTALGGLIAAPFAVVRLFFTSRQTVAQEHGLVTDRINKAVEALGAEKDTTVFGRQVQICYGKKTTRVLAFSKGDEPKLEANMIGHPIFYDNFEEDGVSDWQPHQRVDTYERSKTVIEWMEDQMTLGADEAIRSTSDWRPYTVTRQNREVRIGGLLSLEKISEDHPETHIQVMQILTAYIRENASTKPQPLPREILRRSQWWAWQRENSAPP
ncbi:MAG: hypothetical protein MK098_14880, partial [Marinovum sp.]|nr:hypothetical protein [Marinovum sp.]